MISELEQETLDIDWFFVYGDNIAFVASAGGRLPQSVAQWSLDNIAEISIFFRNLPITSQVVINADLHKRVSPPIDEQYLEDFVKMAKRGLFSFDKTILSNFSDTHYHLVAEPVTPLKFDRLPKEIRDSISETQYEGNLSSILDIKLIK